MIELTDPQNDIFMQAAKSSLQHPTIMYVAKQDIQSWVQIAIARYPVTGTGVNKVKYAGVNWLEFRPFNSRATNLHAMKPRNPSPNTVYYYCPETVIKSLPKLYEICRSHAILNIKRGK